MKNAGRAAGLLMLTSMAVCRSQLPAMPDPTIQQTYVLHRSSSRETTGANADARTVTPGQTLTVLDTDGPGEISHIWFTMDDSEPFFLKRVVLRMYWDGETTSRRRLGTSSVWDSGTTSPGNRRCWRQARTKR